MSIQKCYYVIAGYDLTNYIVDEEKFYNEWKWSDEGEQYLDYQNQGNIQLFDGGMSSNHIYLGYIFANGDEFDFDTVKFNQRDVESVMVKVNKVLNHLQEIGLIKDNHSITEPLQYEIIAFEESY